MLLLRQSADGPELNGRFEQSGVIHDVTASLRYRVVRLWEAPVDQLLRGSIGVVPLAPLADVEPAALPGVLHRLDDRLGREARPSTASALRAATRFLLSLRYDADQIRAWVQTMSWLRDTPLYQVAVEEGREEGRVDEARRLILELGAERLGPPERAVVDAIERIDDHDELKRLIRGTFNVTSWHELLADARGR